MKQVTHVKLVSLVDWIIDHATSSSQLILTKASEWGPLCVFFVGERVFRAEIMADEVFWMIRWWRVLVTKRACRLLFVSSITGTGATLTYTKYKIHKCKIQNTNTTGKRGDSLWRDHFICMMKVRGKKSLSIWHLLISAGYTYWGYITHVYLNGACLVFTKCCQWLLHFYLEPPPLLEPALWFP